MIKTISKRYIQVPILLSIVVLGTGLRFYRLGSKSLWMDEVAVAVESVSSLGELPRTVLWHSAPPLHYFLVHFSESFLGNIEFAVRLPSALMGILSVPLLFEVGRCLYGKWEGVLTALLLTISPVHIYYSQEARTYAVWTFFTLLSVYCFLRALREDRALYWVEFVLAASLATYTNFLAFFELAVLLVYVEVLVHLQSSLVSRRVLARFLGSLLVLAALYVPQVHLIVTSGELAEGQGSIVDLLREQGVRSTTLTFLGALGPKIGAIIREFSPTWTVPFILFGLLGLVRTFRQEAILAALLLLHLVLYPALVILFLTNRSFFHVRYFTPCLPFYLLFVARGVTWVIRWLVRSVACWTHRRVERQSAVAFAIVVPIVALFGLMSVNPLAVYYGTEKQDYRGAAEYVEKHMLPGDAVIIGIFDGEWFEYYFSPPTLQNSKVRPRTLAELQTLVAPNRRIWYVYSMEELTAAREDQELYDWIHNHFDKERDFSALTSNGQVHVYRYGEPSREAIEDEVARLEGLPTEGSSGQQVQKVDLATAYFTLGQWERVVESLNPLLVDSTTDSLVAARVYTMLGNAFLRLGDPESAVEAYVQALAIQPWNTLTLNVLNQIFQTGELSIDEQRNLLANAGFEGGQAEWNVYNPSGQNARYSVDQEYAVSGSYSGLLIGSDDQYHGGWYQQMRVQSDRAYLFSCFIRTKGKQGLRVRPLYWESYADGQPHGHWREELLPGMEWTYKATVFVVQDSEDDLVTLYPVLVTGRGQVWIDEIRVVELAGLGRIGLQ